MSRSTLAVAVCLVLALMPGCAPSAPQEAAVKSPAVAAPDSSAAATDQDLNNAIQQPLDRARAVEGDLMKAAEEADQAMKDQGG